jgi:hypothetical protein
MMTFAERFGVSRILSAVNREYIGDVNGKKKGVLNMFHLRRRSLRRRVYMHKLMTFVSMEWHASKFHKTFLDMEQQGRVITC